jgi:hypothetical protein
MTLTQQRLFFRQSRRDCLLARARVQDLDGGRPSWATATAELPPDGLSPRANRDGRDGGGAARNLPSASALGAIALPLGGTTRVGMRADAALGCACLCEGKATHPMPAASSHTQNLAEDERP